MKQPHTCGDIHPATPQPMPVRFEFTRPTATTVAVAGTFNDWNPSAHALRPSEGGLWLTEMTLLPGTYEYCLVVDGQWMPDPLAPVAIANPFGGCNSVLEVFASPDAEHLFNAEHFPLNSSTE